jgi:hypothetical protein
MLGVMFVAAMLVLGTGGWLLTRGGFVRPAHPEVAAREAAEALKKAKAKAAATPAPLASLPEAAPVAPEPAAAPAEPPAPPAEAVPAAAVEPPLEAAPTEPVPVAPVAPAVREPVRPAAGAAEPRVRQAAPGWRPPEPAPAPAPATDAPQLTITPQPTTAPALSVRPAAAAPAPAPTGAMPDTPTREDVARAMDSVRSRVTACAAGKHGVAEVDLTVLGTGDVSHVVVTGDFSGTAEGSCIAREARTARFSPFVKPRFRLIYPFQL